MNAPASPAADTLRLLPVTAREKLLERGWTGADLIGLVRDWPGADSLDLADLADLAKDLQDLVPAVTADLTRRWLRQTCARTPSGISWSTDRRLGPSGTYSGVAGLAAAYTLAAAGDCVLALLGWAAGLTSQELTVMVTAGPIDRDGLLALAGLHTPAAA